MHILIHKVPYKNVEEMHSLKQYFRLNSSSVNSTCGMLFKVSMKWRFHHIFFHNPVYMN